MGERLGRYELVPRIASGEWTEVWSALAHGPSGISKRVALTVTSADSAGDPEAAKLLADEAALAAHWSHPNLVQVFEYGEASGRCFLAMEYVDGIPLRTLLERADGARRRLPVPVAVYVARAVLEGLAHAHEAVGADGKGLGVIHHQVTPSKVLIARDGTVKLGGFRLATAALPGRLAQPEPGLMKGELRYLAPEQLLGAPLDARVDLFAAGAVLFEMLAGGFLFDDENEVEVMKAVRDARLRPFPPEAAVPDALRDILSKALARVPSDRFTSAAEFSRALTAFLAHERLAVSAADLAACIE